MTDHHAAPPPAGPVPWDKDFALRLLADMVRIRRMEEKSAEMYGAGKIRGFLHLYIGEEAIAVGVCESLNNEDYITSAHRGHGHCLAKGASVDKMFCELLGKEADVHVPGVDLLAVDHVVDDVLPGQLVLCEEEGEYLVVRDCLGVLKHLAHVVWKKVYWFIKVLVGCPVGLLAHATTYFASKVR